MFNLCGSQWRFSMSFFPTQTDAVSSAQDAPARPEAPGRSGLSPKAILFGALFGSAAAFLFAPDMSSVVAGDDAGIRSFFTNENARRRTPPEQAFRPSFAPAQQVAANRRRAPNAARAAQARDGGADRTATPSQASAYAPIDLRAPIPALDAIGAATIRDPAAVRAKEARARASSSTSRPAPAPKSASFEPMGKRAICVRLCDGFHFPLGAVRASGDARAQASMCQNLCPGAPARLYVMPAGSEKVEDATSLDGVRYDRLPVAFRHASARDNTCSCRPAGAAADTPLMSLLDDVTMRRGDAVMTAKGVRVFRGATRWPLRQRDFVRIGETKMSRASRAALATLDRLNARAKRAQEAARQAAASRISPRGDVL